VRDESQDSFGRIYSLLLLLLFKYLTTLPCLCEIKRKKEEGKKRKKRGKKERIQNFVDVGLSFTLQSTSPSMRPGIATKTFLWPHFLGNFVHPPSFPDFLIECNFYML
jgi:hypothetical protein